MTSTSDSSTSSYRIRSVLRPSEPGQGQGAGNQGTHSPTHTTPHHTTRGSEPQWNGKGQQDVTKSCLLGV